MVQRMVNGLYVVVHARKVVFGWSFARISCGLASLKGESRREI